MIKKRSRLKGYPYVYHPFTKYYIQLARKGLLGHCFLVHNIRIPFE